MDWVEIKTEDILAHMPTDVKTRYAEWLVANPDRAGRLDQLAKNALREFRDNLTSVKANIVDPRETWVPQSAVRHLETIVLFTLGMEMGLPLDSAAIGARYSADIFLRQILMGRYKTTTDAAGEPSPRYSIPGRAALSGRALPSLLAACLFAGSAFAGWIRPDGAPPTDAQVVATFVPSAYSISGTSLFGHLQGIDSALGSKASTAYVDSAVSGIAATNAADPVARSIAQSALLAANAAAVQAHDAFSAAQSAVPYHSQPSYRGIRLGDPSNGVHSGISLSNPGQTNFWNFAVFGSNVFEITSSGWKALWTMAEGTNRAVWRGDVSPVSVVFPKGDYLTSDGTNLFYVPANRAATNILTGN